MSIVEMMRQALIDSGVPANKVAEMSEQQLANECKARNIKLQEGLNNNANWGRGDEVSFTTTATKGDENKSSGNQTEELGYMERIVRRFADLVNTFLPIRNSSSEITINTIDITLEDPDPREPLRQAAIILIKRADLKDVRVEFDQIIENEISKRKGEIKALEREMRSSIDKIKNTNILDEINSLNKKLTCNLSSIEFNKNLISDLEHYKRDVKSMMEDLDKSATLQERETVLNKEEYIDILCYYIQNIQ